MSKAPVPYTKAQFIQDIMYITGWSKKEASFFVSEMHNRAAHCPSDTLRIRQICKEMGYGEGYFHGCVDA